MDKANYTKVRFKCKKVNFIAPLLTKMHTEPQFQFWFHSLLLCRQMPKRNFSAKHWYRKFEERHTLMWKITINVAFPFENLHSIQNLISILKHFIRNNIKYGVVNGSHTRLGLVFNCLLLILDCISYKF